MAYHGVTVPNQIMAKDIDTLVRNIKCASELDNGNIVFLTSGISGTSGEREVWTASTPTSSTVTGAWIIDEPEIVMTNSQYKGLDPDPRNFYIPANTIATATKVKKYDIREFTAENFSNTRNTENYAGIGSSGAKLTWQASSSNALYKLVETTTIALSTGAPGSNRITAYRMEAVDE